MRVEQSCFNAAVLAEILEGHEAIDKIFYPGKKSHPGHELAQK